MGTFDSPQVIGLSIYIDVFGSFVDQRNASCEISDKLCNVANEYEAERWAIIFLKR